MGNTWEVLAWSKHNDDEYSDPLVYGGESLLKAFAAFFRAKRKGYGCVTIKWR